MSYVFFGPRLEQAGVHTRRGNPGLVLEQCELCLDPVYNGEPVSVACTNLHVFHKRCLDAWKASNRSQDIVSKCPLCRQIMNLYAANLTVGQVGNLLDEYSEGVWEQVARIRARIATFEDTLRDEAKLRERSLHMLTHADVEFARQEQLLNIQQCEIEIEVVTHMIRSLEHGMDQDMRRVYADDVALRRRFLEFQERAVEAEAARPDLNASYLLELAKFREGIAAGMAQVLKLERETVPQCLKYIDRARASRRGGAA